jgi:hypothetical protein
MISGANVAALPSLGKTPRFEQNSTEIRCGNSISITLYGKFELEFSLCFPSP